MSWLFTPLLPSIPASGDAAPLDAEAGVFALSGQVVIPGVPSLVADSGSFALEGQNATFSVEGEGSNSLVYKGYGLRQVATYWGAPAEDGSGGLVFSDPIQLRVRWEERSEVWHARTGEQFISYARVYVGLEVTHIDIGGYLYLGQSTEGDPTALDGAWRIRDYRESPALRGLKVQKRAVL
jgi:hypothetical protein